MRAKVDLYMTTGVRLVWLVDPLTQTVEEVRPAAGGSQVAVQSEWFALFQRGPLLGLLAFELLMVVYVVVSIPVELALAAALWRTSPALTATYLAVSLVGIVTFIAARPAFEIGILSEGYAAATTTPKDRCTRPRDSRRWPPSTAPPFG